MYKSFLLVVFTAFSTLLFSQSKPDKIVNLGNRHTELYYFSATNYDSIRFTIKGEKDTVLRETFYRNGHINEQIWGKDSSFYFSLDKRLEYKRFGLPDEGEADSTVYFHENGQIASISSFHSYVSRFEMEMDEKGKVIKRIDEHSYGEKGWYGVVSDAKGKIYSRSNDTIGKAKVVWQHDTFYHRNGLPLFISVRNNVDFDLVQNFYDIKGNLIEAITPDSSVLIPFKDNVDCFYGFKNKRNDTIYFPQFENYVSRRNNFIAVSNSNECRIMSLDGHYIKTPKMEGIETISDYNFLIQTEVKGWLSSIKEIGRFASRGGYMPDLNGYYTYTIEGKFGVIDRNGQQIMSPQNLKVNGYYSDNQLFSFQQYFPNDPTNTLMEKGYLKANGERLFPQYKRIEMVKNGYFMYTKDGSKLGASSGYIHGLLDKSGKEILPCKFDNINQIGDSRLWVVEIKTDSGHFDRRGLFDELNKRWIIDTMDYFFNWDNIFERKGYTVFNSKKTNKHGVFTEKGDIVLPLTFDGLELIDNGAGFFIARKDKKYSFFSLHDQRNHLTYDYLASADVVSRNDSTTVEMPLFWAKIKDKWGIVDSNDRVIRPFTIDYVAQLDGTSYFVEKEKVQGFDRFSYPRESNLLDAFKEEKIVADCHLIEDYDNNFFFDQTGKVLIPPQYKLVFNDNITMYGEKYTYHLIENEQKNRKIVFLQTGEVIDYPFQFNIKSASINSKLIVVYDENAKHKNQNFGLVTTEGKQLVPCNHYAIAIADMEEGIYFTRLDTPKNDNQYELSQIQYDSLTEMDRGWFMFNSEGILLNKQPFRFPFNFNGALGLGMQGDTYNLYKKDGSIYSANNPNGAPPQYRNVRMDANTGFYYCFQNQGLTTTVSIKRQDGKTFLESGRYDGAGAFYGKYALVSLAGKIGLIDSFGREIIAPKDLKTYNEGNLMDSLNLVNLQYENQLNEMVVDDSNLQKFSEIERMIQSLPVKVRNNFTYSDSLKYVPAMRNTIAHLLIETAIQTALWRVGDYHINRAHYFAETEQSDLNIYLDSNSGQLSLNELKTTDKTIAFVLSNDNYPYILLESEGAPRHLFYNFYLRNNRWNTLQINDLLQIQGEKRWQFNELLTRKVKAMKDEEIDCSNTSAFVAQVENRFMLTKDGVDFCFDSKKDDGKLAIVSFSWAELEGFLKMRF